MLKIIAPLWAAVAVSWGGSAGAASVIVQGRLVAELGYPYVDPNLELGDQVIASISFNPHSSIQLGGGYAIAGMTGLNVSSNGFNMPFSDIFDGAWIATQYFETNCEAELGPGCLHPEENRFVSGAAIIYKGSKVVGLIGTSAPNSLSGDHGPDYNLGSWMGPSPSGYIGFDGYCVRQSVSAPYVCSSNGGWHASSQFRITSQSYLPFYKSQGFLGEWDFGGASISGVPEPGTWAMMIVGFGLAGSALRRRNLGSAAA